MMFGLAQTATAQSKTKAEKAFSKELNKVLAKSTQHDTGYEGVMSIDTPFAISKAGILSVTVRYTTDSAVKRVRLAAPVRGIKEVLYDLYLILEYATDVVTVYESENSNGAFKEIGKGNRFRVGAPLPENAVYKKRVQHALDKVNTHYKNL